MSRSSSAILLLPAAAVVCALGGCKPAPMKWRPPAERKVARTPEEQFSEGRLLMMAGKFAEAAPVLRALDEKNATAAEPMRSWATLYAGLATLLAGQEEAARPLFAKLGQQGPEAGGKLGSFFGEVGGRLGGEAEVPSSAARNYDRFTYEALALFLYGLKDESVGKFDDALVFYRQFTTAAPREPEPWIGFNSQIGKFQKIANGLLEYEDQVHSAQGLNARKKQADPEKKAAALAAAKAARREIRHSSKLAVSVDKALGLFEEEVGEQMKASAEESEADAKVFPAAKAEFERALAQNQFADAKAAILAVTLHSEKMKQEADVLILKADYLEKFKFFLANELTLTGYPKPIALKDGSKVPEGVAKLDDKSIYVREKGAVRPVPWGDVSTESVYEMAKSLLNPAEDKDAAAARKWHLGIYAVHIGKAAEGRALMAAAAEAQPAYAPEMPLILGEPAPAP